MRIFQQKTEGCQNQLFVIFFTFFHFSVVSGKSADFVKCSSHFRHFLVENAAKHKKSMKK